MIDFLNNLLGLLGSNPTLTPWILLIIMFILFAMAAGRAGKMALSNVDTLLKQGEAFAARLEKEVARKDEIIAARDARIKMLEDDQDTTVDFVTNQRREQAALIDKIYDLERTNKGLINDYHNALSLLEIEKDKKNDKPY